MVKGVILGTMMLAACSAHTKHEWLSFFFDGVPPEKKEAPAGDGLSPGAPAPQAGTPAVPPSVAKAPARVVHRPYGERRCDACHESKFSQKLRGETGEVCLLCHKNLYAGAKFRHAPAEDGDCLVCHHPHESAERFLLTRKGQEVCLDCHEKKEAGPHADIGETACQSCHDPHGGDNLLYLRPGEQRQPAGSPAPAPP